MQQNRTMRDGLNIRLPDGLRDHLKTRAAENRRSMNAEVVFHLERALRSATAATGETLQGEAPAAASDETALAGGPIHQRS
jgi:plasmid stability protein